MWVIWANFLSPLVNLLSSLFWLEVRDGPFASREHISSSSGVGASEVRRIFLVWLTLDPLAWLSGEGHKMRQSILLRQAPPYRL